MLKITGFSESLPCKWRSVNIPKCLPKCAQAETRALWLLSLRIPMKAASDSDGKAASHSDPKRPLFQRSELAGVIVAVG
jgi:hypothetical protein